MRAAPAPPTRTCFPGLREAFETPAPCRTVGVDVAPTTVFSPGEAEPLTDTLRRAGRAALSGGVPGALAMAANVAALMPLRTVVNVQYRDGGSLRGAASRLWADGGARRFYRGVGPALLQGPLSRFGDTASNMGALALLDASPAAGLPVAVKTAAGSASAGLFRVFLMPLDACKTMLQVEGKGGLQALAAKVRAGGPRVLYHGAAAAAAATAAGHYPWFVIYNALESRLAPRRALHERLARAAFIGFCASAVSDTVSNSIRVVKVSKQAAVTPVTYPHVVRAIWAAEGAAGLFGRGLKAKLLSNALQGMLFSVLWRLGQDAWGRDRAGERVKGA
jgi:hypothetical protein